MLSTRRSSVSSSPSSSSPSKRQRVTPLWTRLINNKEQHDPIIMNETIPLAKLEIFCDTELLESKYKDKSKKQWDEWIKTARMQYEGRSGSRVFYAQNDYGKLAKENVPAYRGSTHIGRMFTQDKRGFSIMRCQSVCKEIRNTLLHGQYVDIDIVNCIPTICCHLFGHVGLPTLKHYIENREEIFQEMKDLTVMGINLEGCAHSLPSSIVKRAVMSILNNCSTDFFGFYGDDIGYGRSISRIPFFKDLVRERSLIYDEIRSTYPAFYDLCAEMCRVRGTRNINSRALSLLCMDVENECLRAMVNKIKEIFRGKEVDSLILMFDGLMIPKDMFESEEDLIEQLEDAIFADVGVEVQLKEKPLEPYLPDFVVHEEIGPLKNCSQTYAEWKENFEKTNYRINSPVMYVREGEFGVQYYAQQKFVKEVCAMEDEDFMKEWIKDKQKRMYEAEVFMPPPRVAKPSCLNTYHGLRAEKLQPVPDELVEDLVKPIIYHLRLLSGGVKTNTEYVLNWLARRIQQPGVLPTVGLGFRSVEGTGKDSFFNFYGKKIIGEEYFTQAGEMTELFRDLHTTDMKDKLLIVVSECTRSDNNSVRNKLKSFMTSPTCKFRPLYVQQMTRDNYCGVVMFGQDQQFLNMEGDDRRFVVMDCLPIHANDPSYFKKFIDHIERDEAARAFYQYLMNRDISGFRISADRPMTTARTNMTQFSAKALYMFLKKYVPMLYERENPPGAVAEVLSVYAKRSELFDEYVSYVQETMPKYAADIATKRKCFSELVVLSNDSIITKEDGKAMMTFRRVKIDGFYGYRIIVKEFMEWIKKMVPDEVATNYDEDLLES